MSTYLKLNLNFTWTNRWILEKFIFSLVIPNDNSWWFQAEIWDYDDGDEGLERMAASDEAILPVFFITYITCLQFVSFSLLPGLIIRCFFFSCYACTSRKVEWMENNWRPKANCKYKFVWKKILQNYLFFLFISFNLFIYIEYFLSFFFLIVELSIIFFTIVCSSKFKRISWFHNVFVLKE